MFRNTKDETGFLSILYAIGPKPLNIWEASVKNGHVQRVKDLDIDSAALEIVGANVNNNFLTCPADANGVLGIKMPILVFLIKHLRKYFAFEIVIMDNKKIKRRFRATNFQTTTRVKANVCTIPMKLEDGWNQVHIDLEDFTKKAFNSEYVETLRIRRVYFTNLPVNSKKIPPEYKVFAAIEEEGVKEKYNSSASNVVVEDVGGEN